MKRSEHVRNGKVWITDRKLQIGNCSEKGKGHVDWVHIFELLKMCLMT